MLRYGSPGTMILRIVHAERADACPFVRVQLLERQIATQEERDDRIAARMMAHAAIGMQIGTGPIIERLRRIMRIDQSRRIVRSRDLTGRGQHALSGQAGSIGRRRADRHGRRADPTGCSVKPSTNLGPALWHSLHSFMAFTCQVRSTMPPWQSASATCSDRLAPVDGTSDRVAPGFVPEVTVRMPGAVLVVQQLGFQSEAIARLACGQRQMLNEYGAFRIHRRRVGRRWTIESDHCRESPPNAALVAPSIQRSTLHAVRHHAGAGSIVFSDVNKPVWLRRRGKAGRGVFQTGRQQFVDHAGEVVIEHEQFALAALR